MVRVSRIPLISAARQYLRDAAILSRFGSFADSGRRAVCNPQRTLFVDVWVMFFEFLRIGAAHVSRDPVVLLFLNGRTCFDCVTAYQKSWERRLGEPSRRTSV